MKTALGGEKTPYPSLFIVYSTVLRADKFCLRASAVSGILTPSL
jgi:hypothetical protein